jgi:predicted RNA-binding Zn-ribbon protein involved in translation (DUF1610 family)
MVPIWIWRGWLDLSGRKTFFGFYTFRHGDGYRTSFDETPGQFAFVCCYFGALALFATIWPFREARRAQRQEEEDAVQFATCPNCGKIKLRPPSGRYKCSSCGTIFEIE